MKFLVTVTSLALFYNILCASTTIQNQNGENKNSHSGINNQEPGQDGMDNWQFRDYAKEEPHQLSHRLKIPIPNQDAFHQGLPKPPYNSPLLKATTATPSLTDLRNIMDRNIMDWGEIPNHNPKKKRIKEDRALGDDWNEDEVEVTEAPPRRKHHHHHRHRKHQAQEENSFPELLPDDQFPSNKATSSTTHPFLEPLFNSTNYEEQNETFIHCKVEEESEIEVFLHKEGIRSKGTHYRDGILVEHRTFPRPGRKGKFGKMMFQLFPKFKGEVSNEGVDYGLGTFTLTIDNKIVWIDERAQEDPTVFTVGMFENTGVKEYLITIKGPGNQKHFPVAKGSNIILKFVSELRNKDCVRLDIITKLWKRNRGIFQCSNSEESDIKIHLKEDSITSEAYHLKNGDISEKKSIPPEGKKIKFRKIQFKLTPHIKEKEGKPVPEEEDAPPFGYGKFILTIHDEEQKVHEKVEANTIVFTAEIKHKKYYISYQLEAEQKVQFEVFNLDAKINFRFIPEVKNEDCVRLDVVTDLWKVKSKKKKKRVVTEDPLGSSESLRTCKVSEETDLVVFLSETGVTSKGRHLKNGEVSDTKRIPPKGKKTKFRKIMYRFSPSYKNGVPKYGFGSYFLTIRDEISSVSNKEFEAEKANFTTEVTVEENGANRFFVIYKTRHGPVEEYEVTVNAEIHFRFVPEMRNRDCVKLNVATDLWKFKKRPPVIEDLSTALEEETICSILEESDIQIFIHKMGITSLASHYKNGVVTEKKMVPPKGNRKFRKIRFTLTPKFKFDFRGNTPAEFGHGQYFLNIDDEASTVSKTVDAFRATFIAEMNDDRTFKVTFQDPETSEDYPVSVNSNIHLKFIPEMRYKKCITLNVQTDLWLAKRRKKNEPTSIEMESRSNIGGRKSSETFSHTTAEEKTEFQIVMTEDTIGWVSTSYNNDFATGTSKFPDDSVEDHYKKIRMHFSSAKGKYALSIKDRKKNVDKDDLKGLVKTMTIFHYKDDLYLVTLQIEGRKPKKYAVGRDADIRLTFFPGEISEDRVDLEVKTKTWKKLHSEGEAANYDFSEPEFYKVQTQGDDSSFEVSAVLKETGDEQGQAEVVSDGFGISAVIKESGDKQTEAEVVADGFGTSAVIKETGDEQAQAEGAEFGVSAVIKEPEEEQGEAAGAELEVSAVIKEPEGEEAETAGTEVDVSAVIKEKDEEQTEAAESEFAISAVIKEKDEEQTQSEVVESDFGISAVIREPSYNQGQAEEGFDIFGVIKEPAYYQQRSDDEANYNFEIFGVIKEPAYYQQGSEDEANYNFEIFGVIREPNYQIQANDDEENYHFEIFGVIPEPAYYQIDANDEENYHWEIFGVFKEPSYYQIQPQGPDTAAAVFQHCDETDEYTEITINFDEESIGWHGVLMRGGAINTTSDFPEVPKKYRKIRLKLFPEIKESERKPEAGYGTFNFKIDGEGENVDENFEANEATMTIEKIKNSYEILFELDDKKKNFKVQKTNGVTLIFQPEGKYKECIDLNVKTKAWGEKKPKKRKDESENLLAKSRKRKKDPSENLLAKSRKRDKKPDETTTTLHTCSLESGEYTEVLITQSDETLGWRGTLFQNGVVSTISEFPADENKRYKKLRLKLIPKLNQTTQARAISEPDVYGIYNFTIEKNGEKAVETFEAKNATFIIERIKDDIKYDFEHSPDQHKKFMVGKSAKVYLEFFPKDITICTDLEIKTTGWKKKPKKIDDFILTTAAYDFSKPLKRSRENTTDEIKSELQVCSAEGEHTEIQLQFTDQTVGWRGTLFKSSVVSTISEYPEEGKKYRKIRLKLSLGIKNGTGSNPEEIGSFGIFNLKVDGEKDHLDESFEAKSGTIIIEQIKDDLYKVLIEISPSQKKKFMVEKAAKMLLIFKPEETLDHCVDLEILTKGWKKKKKKGVTDDLVTAHYTEPMTTHYQSPKKDDTDVALTFFHNCEESNDKTEIKIVFYENNIGWHGTLFQNEVVNTTSDFPEDKDKKYRKIRLRFSPEIKNSTEPPKASYGKLVFNSEGKDETFEAKNATLTIEKNKDDSYDVLFEIIKGEKRKLKADKSAVIMVTFRPEEMFHECIDLNVLTKGWVKKEKKPGATRPMSTEGRESYDILKAKSRTRGKVSTMDFTKSTEPISTYGRSAYDILKPKSRTRPAKPTTEGRKGYDILKSKSRTRPHKPTEGRKGYEILKSKSRTRGKFEDETTIGGRNAYEILKSKSRTRPHGGGWDYQTDFTHFTEPSYHEGWTETVRTTTVELFTEGWTGHDTLGTSSTRPYGTGWGNTTDFTHSTSTHFLSTHRIYKEGWTDYEIFTSESRTKPHGTGWSGYQTDFRYSHFAHSTAMKMDQTTEDEFDFAPDFPDEFSTASTKPRHSYMGGWAGYDHTTTESRTNVMSSESQTRFDFAHSTQPIHQTREAGFEMRKPKHRKRPHETGLSDDLTTIESDFAHSTRPIHQTREAGSEMRKPKHRKRPHETGLSDDLTTIESSDFDHSSHRIYHTKWAGSEMRKPKHRKRPHETGLSDDLTPLDSSDFANSPQQIYQTREASEIRKAKRRKRPHGTELSDHSTPLDSSDFAHSSHRIYHTKGAASEMRKPKHQKRPHGTELPDHSTSLDSSDFAHSTRPIHSFRREQHSYDSHRLETTNPNFRSPKPTHGSGKSKHPTGFAHSNFLTTKPMRSYQTGHVDEMRKSESSRRPHESEEYTTDLELSGFGSSTKSIHESKLTSETFQSSQRPQPTPFKSTDLERSYSTGNTDSDYITGISETSESDSEFSTRPDYETSQDRTRQISSTYFSSDFDHTGNEYDSAQSSETSDSSGSPIAITTDSDYTTEYNPEAFFTTDESSDSTIMETFETDYSPYSTEPMSSGNYEGFLRRNKKKHSGKESLTKGSPRNYEGFSRENRKKHSGREKLTKGSPRNYEGFSRENRKKHSGREKLTKGSPRNYEGVSRENKKEKESLTKESPRNYEGFSRGNKKEKESLTKESPRNYEGFSRENKKEKESLTKESPRNYEGFSRGNKKGREILTERSLTDLEKFLRKNKKGREILTERSLTDLEKFLKKKKKERESLTTRRPTDLENFLKKKKEERESLTTRRPTDLENFLKKKKKERESLTKGIQNEEGERALGEKSEESGKKSKKPKNKSNEKEVPPTFLQDVPGSRFLRIDEENVTEDFEIFGVISETKARKPKKKPEDFKIFGVIPEKQKKKQEDFEVFAVIPEKTKKKQEDFEVFAVIPEKQKRNPKKIKTTKKPKPPKNVCPSETKEIILNLSKERMGWLETHLINGVQDKSSEFPPLSDTKEYNKIGLHLMPKFQNELKTKNPKRGFGTYDLKIVDGERTIKKQLKAINSTLTVQLEKSSNIYLVTFVSDSSPAKKYEVTRAAIVSMLFKPKTGHKDCIVLNTSQFQKKGKRNPNEIVKAKARSRAPQPTQPLTTRVADEILKAKSRTRALLTTQAPVQLLTTRQANEIVKAKSRKRTKPPKHGYAGWAKRVKKKPVITRPPFHGYEGWMKRALRPAITDAPMPHGYDGWAEKLPRRPVITEPITHGYEGWAEKLRKLPVRTAPPQRRKGWPGGRRKKLRFNNNNPFDRPWLERALNVSPTKQRVQSSVKIPTNKMMSPTSRIKKKKGKMKGRKVKTTVSIRPIRIATTFVPRTLSPFKTMKPKGKRMKDEKQMAKPIKRAKGKGWKSTESVTSTTKKTTKPTRKSTTKRKGWKSTESVTSTTKKITKPTRKPTTKRKGWKSTESVTVKPTKLTRKPTKRRGWKSTESVTPIRITTNKMPSPGPIITPINKALVSNQETTFSIKPISSTTKKAKRTKKPKHKNKKGRGWKSTESVTTTLKTTRRLTKRPVTTIKKTTKRRGWKSTESTTTTMSTIGEGWDSTDGATSTQMTTNKIIYTASTTTPKKKIRAFSTKARKNVTKKARKTRKPTKKLRQIANKITKGKDWKSTEGIPAKPKKISVTRKPGKKRKGGRIKIKQALVAKPTKPSKNAASKPSKKIPSKTPKPGRDVNKSPRKIRTTSTIRIKKMVQPQSTPASRNEKEGMRAKGRRRPFKNQSATSQPSFSLFEENDNPISNLFEESDSQPLMPTMKIPNETPGRVVNVSPRKIRTTSAIRIKKVVQPQSTPASRDEKESMRAKGRRRPLENQSATSQPSSSLLEESVKPSSRRRNSQPLMPTMKIPKETPQVEKALVEEGPKKEEKGAGPSPIFSQDDVPQLSPMPPESPGWVKPMDKGKAWEKPDSEERNEDEMLKAKSRSRPAPTTSQDFHKPEEIESPGWDKGNAWQKPETTERDEDEMLKAKSRKRPVQTESQDLHNPESSGWVKPADKGKAWQKPETTDRDENELLKAKSRRRFAQPTSQDDRRTDSPGWAKPVEQGKSWQKSDTTERTEDELLKAKSRRRPNQITTQDRPRIEKTDSPGWARPTEMRNSWGKPDTTERNENELLKAKSRTRAFESTEDLPDSVEEAEMPSQPNQLSEEEYPETKFTTQEMEIRPTKIRFQPNPRRKMTTEFNDRDENEMLKSKSRNRLHSGTTMEGSAKPTFKPISSEKLKGWEKTTSKEGWVTPEAKGWANPQRTNSHAVEMLAEFTTTKIRFKPTPKERLTADRNSNEMLKSKSRNRPGKTDDFKPPDKPFFNEPAEEDYDESNKAIPTIDREEDENMKSKQILRMKTTGQIQIPAESWTKSTREENELLKAQSRKRPFETTFEPHIDITGPSSAEDDDFPSSESQTKSRPSTTEFQGVVVGPRKKTNQTAKPIEIEETKFHEEEKKHEFCDEEEHTEVEIILNRKTISWEGSHFRGEKLVETIFFPENDTEEAEKKYAKVELKLTPEFRTKKKMPKTHSYGIYSLVIRDGDDIYNKQWDGVKTIVTIVNKGKKIFKLKFKWLKISKEYEVRSDAEIGINFRPDVSVGGCIDMQMKTKGWERKPVLKKKKNQNEENKGWKKPDVGWAKVTPTILPPQMTTARNSNEAMKSKSRSRLKPTENVEIPPSTFKHIPTEGDDGWGEGPAEEGWGQPEEEGADDKNANEMLKSKNRFRIVTTESFFPTITTFSAENFRQSTPPIRLEERDSDEIMKSKMRSRDKTTESQEFIQQEDKTEGYVKETPGWVKETPGWVRETPPQKIIPVRYTVPSREADESLKRETQPQPAFSPPRGRFEMMKSKKRSRVITTAAEVSPPEFIPPHERTFNEHEVPPALPEEAQVRDEETTEPALLVFLEPTTTPDRKGYEVWKSKNRIRIQTTLSTETDFEENITPIEKKEPQGKGGEQTEGWVKETPPQKVVPVRYTAPPRGDSEMAKSKNRFRIPKTEPAGQGWKKPEPVEESMAKPKARDNGWVKPEPIDHGWRKPEPVTQGWKMSEPVEESLPKPKARDQGWVKPEPVEESLPKPKARDQGWVKPEPVEESLPKPKARDQGWVKPAPITQVWKNPEPVEESLPKHKARDQGWVKPEPVTQGWKIPEPVTQGWVKPEPVTQGWKKPETVEESLPKHKARDQGWVKPERVTQGWVKPEPVTQGWKKPEMAEESLPKPRERDQGWLKPEQAEQSLPKPKARDQGWVKPERVIQGWVKPEPVTQGWKKPEPVIQGWKKPEPVDQGWKKPEPVDQGWVKPEEAKQSLAKPKARAQGWAKPEPIGKGWAKPEPVDQGWVKPKQIEQRLAKPKSRDQGWEKPEVVDQGWAKPEPIDQGWVKPAAVDKGWGKPESVEHGWAKPEPVHQGWNKPTGNDEGWAKPVPEHQDWMPETRDQGLEKPIRNSPLQETPRDKTATSREEVDLESGDQTEESETGPDDFWPEPKKVSAEQPQPEPRFESLPKQGNRQNSAMSPGADRSFDNENNPETNSDDFKPYPEATSGESMVKTPKLTESDSGKIETFNKSFIFCHPTEDLRIQMLLLPETIKYRADHYKDGALVEATDMPSCNSKDYRKIRFYLSPKYVQPCAEEDERKFGKYHLTIKEVTNTIRDEDVADVATLTVKIRNDEHNKYIAVMRQDNRKTPVKKYELSNKADIQFVFKPLEQMKTKCISLNMVIKLWKRGDSSNVGWSIEGD